MIAVSFRHYQVALLPRTPTSDRHGLAVEFNSNTFEKHKREQIDSDSSQKTFTRNLDTKFPQTFSGFESSFVSDSCSLVLTAKRIRDKKNTSDSY
jgi:hypothetical protein